MKPVDVFPYVMLQPKMKSVKESKVILFNGKPMFQCTTTKGGISKHIKTKVEVFEFAKRAFDALKINTSGAFLSDGVSRVDMFINNSGDLVVNEVENLDANFSSNSLDYSLTGEFLKTYYEVVIRNCLQELSFIKCI